MTKQTYPLELKRDTVALVRKNHVVDADPKLGQQCQAGSRSRRNTPSEFGVWTLWGDVDVKDGSAWRTRTGS